MSETAAFEPFFGREPGVIWAADVPADEFTGIMEQIGDAEGLAGVKIGVEIAAGLTLKEATRIVHANSNAKVQYDHQKAGNDIPETGYDLKKDEAGSFLRTVMRGEVDSVILFPFAGPVTQTVWTNALQDGGFNVFTGAEMTHPGFTEAEGGSISQDDMERIIDKALELGVDHFILPGNKPDRMEFWQQRIEAVRGAGQYAVASPGLINQGGDITAGALAAGDFWVPIIGRAIHDNPNMDPREAVEYYAQLRSAA